MGAYDDAMVKSLTTGCTSYFDDILIKAKVHVKTYWRHDPKTGKLVQVQEHEAEHQGAHVMFNAGHKVRVTSGAHEGKELEIKGYDPDKKVFRTKHADNPNIAVSPHRIEHVDPEAGKPDWAKKKETKNESEDDIPSHKKGAVKAVADGQFVDYFDKDGKKVGTKKIGNASQAKEQADSDNEEFASKQSSEPSDPDKKANDHKPDNLVVENAAEEPADEEDKNSERDEKWKKELFDLAVKTGDVPEAHTWNNLTVSDWEVLLDDKYQVQDLEQQSLGDKSPLQLTYLTYAANKKGMHFLANKAYNKLKELAGVDDQENGEPVSPSNKNEKQETPTDDDLPLDPWEEEEQVKDSKDKEDQAKISKAKKTVAAMSPKERFNAAYSVDKDSPIYKALKDLEDNPFVSMDDVEVSEPNLPSLGVTKLKVTGKWSKVSLNGKGSAAWCNGFIATIGEEPVIKKLKDPAYCSPYDSDVMEEQHMLDGLIEHLTDQTPEIKPIGVRLFSPLSGGTMTSEDRDIVLFEKQGEDKPFMVDKKYHDFFMKKFSKAVFKAEDEHHAVGVYAGGKIVGMIMPVVMEGQSIKDIKRKIGGKK